MAIDKAGKPQESWARLIEEARRICADGSASCETAVMVLLGDVYPALVPIAANEDERPARPDRKDEVWPFIR